MTASGMDLVSVAERCAEQEVHRNYNSRSTGPNRGNVAAIEHVHPWSQKPLGATRAQSNYVDTDIFVHVER